MMPVVVVAVFVKLFSCYFLAYVFVTGICGQLLTLCHFVTKMGSIFHFCGNHFVPEWPKREFVSFLYWLHSCDKRLVIC